VGAEGREDIEAPLSRPAAARASEARRLVAIDADATRATAEPLGDLKQDFPIGALFGPCV